MDMKKNFWKTLPRPIIVLAPMANVTDEAFRRIIAKYSKPHGPSAMWTEFVSVEGLCSEGRERLLPDLWYSESERPIVAQIFGDKPEQFEHVAAELAAMGFDGIDINMGCPDRGIEKSGGGASLIRHPKLAQEVIRAAKRGAGSVPVSVKTRLGYHRPEHQEWIPALLETAPAALTVHLRTRKEMSLVPAHWETAPELVEIRNRYAPGVPLVGNGDVVSLQDGYEKARVSGMDGVMVGRGIFGNPWFWSGRTPGIEERLRVMVEHTELFEELYLSGRNFFRYSGGKTEHTHDGKPLKNFDVMKKHYKAYANGFDGAKELRIRLMDAADAADVRRITEEFLDALRH